MDPYLMAVSPTIILLLCLRIIPVHGRDLQSWEASCAKMLVAGIRRVPSYNPYWEVQGQTFEDLDGYRVVLQNAAWTM